MLGVLSALSFETELILRKLSGLEEKKISGVSFYKGRLNGKEIVLANMGIGKVNAGIITEALILSFKVDAVIHIGVAGAIAEGLEVLEIVLGNRLSYHDFEREILKHCSPFLEEFEPDGRLFDIAFDFLKKSGGSFKVGRIVTGDSFIDSVQKKQAILSKYPDAVCVDMESAALAHACASNAVPFLVLRSISDFSDEGLGEDNSYERNKLAAANKNIAIVEKIALEYR